MLSKGADVNMANDINETPLHYAAKYDNPIAARLLLESPDIWIEVKRNGQA